MITKGKQNSSQHGGFDLNAIESLVTQGRAVMSCDSETVVSTVFGAIAERKVATFYVTEAQYSDVMTRYWTAERIKATAIKPITEKEKEQIKSKLSLDVDGYFSPIKCPRCETVHGMFDFLQQGIVEHGRESVNAVFNMKNVAVIRVNPKQAAVCIRCKLNLLGAEAPDRYYMCPRYGCCR